MEVSPGAIIGGRYRVERRLGKGGVGEVWAGVSLSDGARVAIKTLLPAASRHRELVTRFRREAEFLERIRSLYVSRVLEFLSDDAHGLVLVMELVDGEPLNELLRRRSLSVEEAAEICWDVLGGIADLHREQIIHRDLKPGNIILQELGNGKRRAVIVDFGMSRFTGVDAHGEEVTALTRVDIAVGTMEYMAPEQILDSRGVTGSADIYALGAMLYRAVAGRHIFADLTDAVLARHKMLNDPPPLETGRSDAFARGFESIVMRMLQRNPKDRYERAEDVLSDLASIGAGGLPDIAIASSPAHSSPAHSSPAHSSPAHSSPAHSSPAHSSPAHSSPAHSSPAHSSPVHAPPEPNSFPSTAQDASPPGSRRGLTVALTLLALWGVALAGVYVFRPHWLALPRGEPPLADEVPISAVTAAPAAAPLPSHPSPSASATASATASASPTASPSVSVAKVPKAPKAPRRPAAPLAQPKPKPPAVPLQTASPAPTPLPLEGDEP